MRPRPDDTPDELLERRPARRRDYRLKRKRRVRLIASGIAASVVVAPTAVILTQLGRDDPPPVTDPASVGA